MIPETKTSNSLPEILKAKEIAKYFRVSCKTVYEAYNKGDLPGFPVGRLRRFYLKDVLAWMQGKRTVTKGRR